MEKCEYLEIRKLYSDDLRALCIKEQWYTKGNCDEYYDLLSSVNTLENVTTEDIVKIARNIYVHSNFDKAGCTTEEIILNIMFKIGRICIIVFKENNMNNVMNESVKTFAEKVQKVGRELYEEFNSLDTDGIKYACPFTDIIDELHEFSLRSIQSTIQTERAGE